MAINIASIEAIFSEALEIPSAEARVVYLARACAADPELRRQVESLLDAHDRAGRFLASPTVSFESGSPEPVGSTIGPYKLLEQIGEGGMGLVYMAEQQHPLRRLVALKIIKPGMDSRQILARFEAEKQALAMMDHENIAKVFDAGTTEAGHPYFVMELVRGIPIDEFCDQKRLTLRERLELFIQVCQAVQHAHQKGIIHRDLKPSNVLVTMHDATVVPKVIDFGIAKALGPSLTEHTLHTGFAQLVGTPLYMSPEQAEMNQLGVDTRSDVYSLGVLLFELLTGTTPFDKEALGGSGLEEMRRMIREDEPPRPSARVSARLRKDEGGRMKDEKKTSPSVSSSSRLGRSSFIFHPSSFQELDWIVMKSLEKDRSRRYESASAFATDIQRYLDDEPVLAGPPSTMYKFHKFARKHRAALATAVAIAASLILGTTASAWQAVRATTAEAQANANATLAQTSAQEAKEKAQEAGAQRDEAKHQRDEVQKQRDEVQALNEKLAAKERELQRNLYASNMNLAQHTWKEGNIPRVQELLEQHRPKAGESDLRGFEWHYLNRLCHAEILSLKGGGRSVAFSPDGKRLASSDRGTWDATKKVQVGAGVQVWDAQTGQELLSLKRHTGSVLSVAYSPDGKRLAFGSSIWDATKNAFVTGEIEVWDAQAGQHIRTLKGHTGNVESVTFSSDGKHLASASGDKTVKVWDAQTGQELLSLKGHTSQVLSVAFSPDGKRLASSGGYPELTVKVWDTQTGQELLALKDTFGSVTFSPDGKRLASSGGFSERTVKVWDAQTGQELLSCKGHNGQINSVSFSPDGKHLASAGWDRMIHVWDAQTGQELLSLKGHSNMIWSVAFSPDGTRLVSASHDGTVKVWDATTSPEARAFGGPIGGRTGGVYGVVFSPDGKLLAGASWDFAVKAQTVKVWDASTGRELLSVKGGTGRNDFSSTFSPDGKRLASAAEDNTVRVWDAQTGQELFSFMIGPSSSVAFNADGKRLASVSRDHLKPEFADMVKVWDAQNGQELFSFKIGPSRGVAFSADGKRLAGPSWDGRGWEGVPGEVKVWDTQTGQELLTVKSNAGPDDTLAFSPDGKRLATTRRLGRAGSPGEIKVWDAQTGQELLTLKGPIAGINNVIFSPDGKRLASSAWFTDTVQVWDAQTGQELLNLKVKTGEINSLAFSPDGHWLASGAGGKVTIWDATPLLEKP